MQKEEEQPQEEEQEEGPQQFIREERQTDFGLEEGRLVVSRDKLIREVIISQELAGCTGEAILTLEGDLLTKTSRATLTQAKNPEMSQAEQLTWNQILGQLALEHLQTLDQQLTLSGGTSQ